MFIVFLENVLSAHFNRMRGWCETMATNQTKTLLAESHGHNYSAGSTFSILLFISPFFSSVFIATEKFSNKMPVLYWSQHMEKSHSASTHCCTAITLRVYSINKYTTFLLFFRHSIFIVLMESTNLLLSYILHYLSIPIWGKRRFSQYLMQLDVLFWLRRKKLCCWFLVTKEHVTKYKRMAHFLIIREQHYEALGMARGINYIRLWIPVDHLLNHVQLLLSNWAHQAWTLRFLNMHKVVVRLKLDIQRAHWWCLLFSLSKIKNIRVTQSSSVYLPLHKLTELQCQASKPTVCSVVVT